jgi:hypothetical protein
MSSDRRASAGTPDGPGQPATPGAPATPGTPKAPAGPGAPATSGAPGALSGACVVLPLVPGFVRPPARRRPLPDAVAVRMLPVPDSAPPYDDEQGGPVPAAGTGPAAGPVSPGRPVPPGRRPARHLTAVAGPEAAAGPAAAAAARAQDPAAPPGWPSQFAQVLAETLAGSRPQRQIAPWTTERARRHIRRLGPLLAAGQQPRVRRVVTFRPATDVVEMTVIVGVGSRVRALAVRLERDGPHRASPGRDAQAARWVAVAVEAA